MGGGCYPGTVLGVHMGGRAATSLGVNRVCCVFWVCSGLNGLSSATGRSAAWACSEWLHTGLPTGGSWSLVEEWAGEVIARVRWETVLSRGGGFV
jgi:hypothetical protein